MWVRRSLVKTGIQIQLVAFVLTSLVFTTNSLGQGKFTGRITDMQGEPMFGVIVVDTNDYSLIGQSDFDGQFSIKILDAKPHIFKMSLVGYEPILEIITTINGQVVNKEFTLIERSLVSNEVKIEAKAVRSADTYMEKIKMNSTTSLDYISSATIKKTGDSNVLSAVARVSFPCNVIVALGEILSGVLRGPMITTA